MEIFELQLIPETSSYSSGIVSEGGVPGIPKLHCPSADHEKLALKIFFGFTRKQRVFSYFCEYFRSSGQFGLVTAVEISMLACWSSLVFQPFVKCPFSSAVVRLITD